MRIYQIGKLLGAKNGPTYNLLVSMKRRVKEAQ